MKISIRELVELIKLAREDMRTLQETKKQQIEKVVQLKSSLRDRYLPQLKDELKKTEATLEQLNDVIAVQWGTIKDLQERIDEYNKNFNESRK